MVVSSIWWRSLICALALCAGVGRADTSVVFPALDRPAMAVRAPEHAVLLAATLAGTRIVAVGERGIVVLSDDGAHTWRQARAVPVSVTLTALQFVNERVGWAVGHGGVVLRTDDAGETWVRQADGRTLAQAAYSVGQSKWAQALLDEGPDKPLLDVRFVDARRGYVIGAYNLAFETRDGGATWSSLMDRLDNPRGSHLYSIAVRGDSLFIAGEQGVMFRSRDGGASFEPLHSGYAGSWFSIVASTDRGLVAAGLRGNAMYSPDDGQTWRAIEGAPPVTLVAGATLPDGQVLLVNQGGQLLATRAGAPFLSLPAPAALPPPSALLLLPDGGMLIVGLTGAIRLPSQKNLAR